MMKMAGRAGVILILMAIISISIFAVSPATAERTGDRSNSSGELASSILISLEKINISDAGSIIIDISPRPAEYIPGAISIPYDQFIDSGGRPKPANVMARILGEAGVSQDDSVIIYGECQPCGGGPSAATYVFWILKYLGHEDVRLLEGGIDEWVAASNPTSAEPVVLAPAIYTPSVDAGLLATYEFVRSGLPMIIDARTEKEFESGSIPGAINIPYESVLDGRRIRDRPELEELFSDLEKKRPVVVYTNTGIKASMIWLPLILLGYDAKIYTWKDWIADHSQLGIDIVKAEADPNPASSGDAVKITVTIREREEYAEGSGVESSPGSGMGPSAGKQMKGDGGPYTLRALIRDEGENRLHGVMLKETSDDSFAGVWTASHPGTYNLGIMARRDNINRLFPHILQIEVR
ncbi:sulfurtransferase [Methanothrix sp.]|uniref:sulfurtransferase n=1 Tax=Methanothrix sp. TaxID=90426 RepID=UPI003C76D9BC